MSHFSFSCVYTTFLILQHETQTQLKKVPSLDTKDKKKFLYFLSVCLIQLSHTVYVSKTFPHFFFFFFLIASSKNTLRAKTFYFSIFIHLLSPSCRHFYRTLDCTEEVEKLEFQFSYPVSFSFCLLPHHHHRRCHHH
jgi:hypothetical protein